MSERIEQFVVDFIGAHGLQLHTDRERSIRRGDGSVETVLVVEVRPRRWLRAVMRAEALLRAHAVDVAVAGGATLAVVLLHQAASR